MNTQSRKRLIIFIFAVSFLLLPILGKLVYLMVAAAPGDPSLPEPSREMERGPILDRAGRILAIQTTLFSVAAFPPAIDDPDSTAAELARLLDLKTDTVREILTRKSQFAWVKRKVPPAESGAVDSLIQQGKIKGISLIEESARTYPKREIASHLLGFVGIDNDGLEGLEWSLNDYLAPPQGVYGNQVYLTIDLNVQYLVQEIARKTYNQYNAESVMILVMEARNGKFLAMTSIPDYDPNHYNDYSREARQNRPVTYAYEPGSVFKVFSIASMLDTGVLSDQDEFYCSGFYEAVDPLIKCVGVHHYVTPQKIIKYSCNVGASYASEKIESRDFYEMLRNFGFGKPTGLRLPGESAGILNDPDSWSGRSKPTIAFGQEISVSAVQVVTAATVLTNNGVLLKPQIVDRVIAPGGEVIEENGRQEVRRVISPETARKMLFMMETATTSGGTAVRAAVEGLRISAKTGTAQVPDKNHGGYYEDKYIASFLGLFPSYDPEYIIYVVIHEPEGESYYGSRIAAPVFKEVVERITPVINISREGDKIVTHPGRGTYSTGKNAEIGKTMPDLRGYSKRNLLPLFQREDLNIVIEGNGFVVRQVPAPGVPVRKGDRIILELE